jgi:hypothetical protein
MRIGRPHVIYKEPRFCEVHECRTGANDTPGVLFCRRRCASHYVALRKYELEGRAAELELADPARPHWEYPGDSAWLISRLERDAPDVPDAPNGQETDNGN